MGFFGSVCVARGFSARGLKADRVWLGAEEGFAEVAWSLARQERALLRLFDAPRRRSGESRPPPGRRIRIGRRSPGRGSRYPASKKGGFTSERIRPGRPSSAAPKASAIITHTASPIRAFIFACPRMK